MSVEATRPKRLNKRCPRRNLPGPSGSKRGESNFVLAFSRAHERRIARTITARAHSSNREVPVLGFGIADFVFVAWNKQGLESEGHAVTARKRWRNPEVSINAFEMKLEGWQRGFAQACRYRFFAHRAFLVIPPTEARLARQRLPLFQQTGIGLLSFDVRSQKITTIYSPPETKPRSRKAYLATLELLASCRVLREVIEIQLDLEARQLGANRKTLIRT